MEYTKVHKTINANNQEFRKCSKKLYFYSGNVVESYYFYSGNAVELVENSSRNVYH